MENCKIVAIAKTSYDLIDLSGFGMDYVKKEAGYVAEKDFESEEKAKDYLHDRAILYHEDSENRTLAEMFEQIDNGFLRLGNVTAFIHKSK